MGLRWRRNTIFALSFFFPGTVFKYKGDGTFSPSLPVDALPSTAAGLGVDFFCSLSFPELRGDD